jgi:hypothetical protein
MNQTHHEKRRYVNFCNLPTELIAINFTEFLTIVFLTWVMLLKSRILSVYILRQKGMNGEERGGWNGEIILQSLYLASD